LRQQYKNKVAGLVLLGTTSESPTLTQNEKIAIVKHVYEFNQQMPLENRKMIVVGIGGNDTAEVIKFGGLVEDYADAFMVTVPHYNKPPQRGIFMHFQMISKCFPEMPIMMYNIPGRTGINMEPQTMIDIIRYCPNVKALKDAGGNLDKTYTLCDDLERHGIIVGKDFKIFSGDDIDAINLITRASASGVISVASNIIPYHVCEYIEDILNGKLNEADGKFDRCVEFIRYLFVETNPIPIKEIMNHAEIYETNHMRLPMVNMTHDKATILHKLYDSLVGVFAETCDDSIKEE
jgi:4-hydroxy-tetrahydrodipicolinate synthase